MMEDTPGLTAQQEVVVYKNGLKICMPKWTSSGNCINIGLKAYRLSTREVTIGYTLRKEEMNTITLPFPASLFGY